jgi:hypothetical protein
VPPELGQRSPAAPTRGHLWAAIAAAAALALVGVLARRRRSRRRSVA